MVLLMTNIDDVVGRRTELNGISKSTNMLVLLTWLHTSILTVGLVQLSKLTPTYLSSSQRSAFRAERLPLYLTFPSTHVTIIAYRSALCARSLSCVRQI